MNVALSFIIKSQTAFLELVSIPHRIVTSSKVKQSRSH